MIRVIKYIILAAMAIALVTVSMANRDPMTLTLLPNELASPLNFNFEITAPGFVIILLTFIAGLTFGFIWEWLREHRQRTTAKAEHRQLVELEQEVKKNAPPATDNGDDVLAILDGR